MVVEDQERALLRRAGCVEQWIDESPMELRCSRYPQSQVPYRTGDRAMDNRSHNSDEAPFLPSLHMSFLYSRHAVLQISRGP